MQTKLKPSCQYYYDPDIWFSTVPADILLAKDICNACPLKSQCLEIGMFQDYGIWGGLTSEERRVLRRRLNIPLPRTSNREPSKAKIIYCDTERSLHRCAICKLHKPYDQFSPSKERPCGHQSYCRDCRQKTRYNGGVRSTARV